MSDLKFYRRIEEGSFLGDWESLQECPKHCADLVNIAGYDAALSQVAALREELATQDRVLRASVSDEHKSCTSPVGAVQNHIGDLEQRLADAERRNSECIALLRRSTAGNGENLKMWWNDRALILQAALNPNPEAASHDE